MSSSSGVSFGGALALLFNNVCGPGVVALAPAFSDGGVTAASALLGCAALASLLAAALLCEALAALPRNADLAGRRELADACLHLLAPRAAKAVLAGAVALFLSVAVASIVETAQTVDVFLLWAAGATCGVRLDGAGVGVCVRAGDAAGSDSPFGATPVASAGYAAVAALALPLGAIDLDGNIGVQVAAALLIVLIAVEWCAQWAVRGLVYDRVPTVGDPASPRAVATTVGTILFNFGFVLTVPSVVGLKRRAARAHPLLVAGVGAGTLLMAGVGLLAAVGVGGDAGDLLDALESARYPPLTRVAAFLFAPAALLTGIPVYSIIARDNLVASRLLATRARAAALAVAVPWLGALALYPGDRLETIVEWTGLFLVVPLNFALPAALCLAARARAASGDERRRQRLSIALALDIDAARGAERPAIDPAPLLRPDDARESSNECGDSLGGAPPSSSAGGLSLVRHELATPAGESVNDAATPRDDTDPEYRFPGAIPGLSDRATRAIAWMLIVLPLVLNAVAVASKIDQEVR